MSSGGPSGQPPVPGGEPRSEPFELSEVEQSQLNQFEGSLDSISVEYKTKVSQANGQIVQRVNGILKADEKPTVPEESIVDSAFVDMGGAANIYIKNINPLSITGFPNLNEAIKIFNEVQFGREFTDRVVLLLRGLSNQDADHVIVRLCRDFVGDNYMSLAFINSAERRGNANTMGVVIADINRIANGCNEINLLTSEIEKLPFKESYQRVKNIIDTLKAAISLIKNVKTNI